MRRETMELLRIFGLEKNKDDVASSLPYGKQRHLEIARALATEPKLLLLDEPTTGQDERSLSEIRKLLLAYKGNGGSVFICTHDLELAAQVTDRVIVLRKGEIIADGRTQSVLNDNNLLCEGGLTSPTLLPICARLGVPPCITVEEVKRYVRKTAVGRN